MRITLALIFAFWMAAFSLVQLIFNSTHMMPVIVGLGAISFALVLLDFYAKHKEYKQSLLPRCHAKRSSDLDRIEEFADEHE